MSHLTIKQPMESTLEARQINLETCVKCSEGQMTADLSGELAILNLKTGVYFGLDAVGARIWSLVNGSRSVREIRDVILEEYDVDASRCERDLVRLLTELNRHNLVEICHAADRKI